MDADAVEVTKVAELVEGSLDFNFGEAAASFANAYENPSTKASIERTLQDALATGLDGVDASAVEIRGVSLRSEVNNSQ